MSKYLDNVKQYVENPNEVAVEALVGHLGLALHNRDASVVAANDPGELDSVRSGYCSKTLDLTPEQTDAAMATVLEKMKGDTAKCRVTFYYLLAQESDTMNRLAG